MIINRLVNFSNSMGHYGVRRFCSNPSAKERLASINKALVDNILPTYAASFNRKIQKYSIANDSAEYFSIALETLMCDRAIYHRLGINRSSNFSSGGIGIWDQEQNKFGSRWTPLIHTIPGVTDKYFSVTASKVIEFVKKIPIDRPFTLVELGCLSCHDMRLIARDIYNLGENYPVRCAGIDINRPWLVVAACLFKSENWADKLQLAIGDVSDRKNLDLLELEGRKMIYCDKLISAMPTETGIKTLENISNFLETDEYALINFTLRNEETSQNLLATTLKNPLVRIDEKKNATTVLYKEKPIQELIQEDYIFKILRNLGLEVQFVRHVHEKKESESNPLVLSNNVHDEYQRGVFVLLKKKSFCYTVPVIKY
ncbi:MAG: hypothetical protein ChlgKO_12010 [Chlamydiales bacterium]